jgi:hypothetical protein
MTHKIHSAKEFISLAEKETGFDLKYRATIWKLMTRYAKLHVQACKIAIAESVDKRYVKTVFNCYPEDNKIN